MSQARGKILRNKTPFIIAKDVKYLWKIPLDTGQAVGGKM
jgi:hypothetical protein